MSKTVDQPVFSTGFLLTGDAKPRDVALQLSRWVKAGRLVQLRRGLYTLAQPYRKIAPHPFLIANALRKASYVSLQSALHYHGLIPEHVPTATSVTTGRPGEIRGAAGPFLFRHIKDSWFHGYENVEVDRDQFAFVASAEKALLDLLYLTPGSDGTDYLRELRLQNVEILRLHQLIEIARKSASRKLIRAVRRLQKWEFDIP